MDLKQKPYKIPQTTNSCHRNLDREKLVVATIPPAIWLTILIRISQRWLQASSVGVLSIKSIIGLESKHWLKHILWTVSKLGEVISFSRHTLFFHPRYPNLSWNGKNKKVNNEEEWNYIHSLGDNKYFYSIYHGEIRDINW